MKVHTEENEPRTDMNIEDCRAAHSVAGVYAECLQNGPNACKYAIPFGYCFLCNHPKLQEILKHTAEIEKLEAV